MEHVASEITATSSRSRARFLQDVLSAHPDKGGSNEAFIALMHERLEPASSIDKTMQLPPRPLAWDRSMLQIYALKAMAQGNQAEARKIIDFAKQSDLDLEDEEDGIYKSN